MSRNTFVQLVAVLASTLFTTPSQAQQVAVRQEDPCKALAALLPNKVAFPETEVYNASLSSYWSQQAQLIRPSCVLAAESAQDVATALKDVLVPSGCQFAVRSGGHGSVVGTANIQDGITIDLTKINNTVLSADSATVSIGGGQRVGNVYSMLAKSGLAIAAVRDNNIGIGGSTLGGGLGFFASHYGFAANSVLEYEVVLANGTIVVANSTVNSDLWSALKGGGGNFGVVTNFVFKTFELGQIWGGDVSFPETAVEQTATVLYDFVADPEYDVSAAVLVTYHYSAASGAPMVAVQYTYDQPVPDAEAFDGFFAIPGQLGNNTNLTTLPEFSVKTEASSPDGLQQITFSTAWENNVEMFLQAFNIWNTSLAGVKGIEGVSFSLTLEPILESTLTNATSENILGIELPPNGLIVVLCSATFASAADYEFMSETTSKFLEALDTASKNLGVYHRYIDMNHAKAEQNVFASYGDENWAFLNSTALRYDPDGVFQTLKPGGFKL